MIIPLSIMDLSQENFQFCQLVFGCCIPDNVCCCSTPNVLMIMISKINYCCYISGDAVINIHYCSRYTSRENLKFLPCIKREKIWLQYYCPFSGKWLALSIIHFKEWIITIFNPFFLSMSTQHQTQPKLYKPLKYWMF